MLIYNNHSGGSCNGIEVLEVDTDTGVIDFIRREGAGRSCHDTAVFLDDVMKAVCPGGNGFHVFSMGGPEGGTLNNPVSMHNIPVQDVSIGHTAAFTNDGEYFVFGHEPGGGGAAECQDHDNERQYTFFMYDVATGTLQGKWVLDIPQSALENCTLHNINFVPTTDGRDILVSGNYQAGTWVIDFTDHDDPVRRLRGSASVGPGELHFWWGLVNVLVQQLHVRVRDHQGLPRLRVGRRGRRERDGTSVP